MHAKDMKRWLLIVGAIVAVAAVGIGGLLWQKNANRLQTVTDTTSINAPAVKTVGNVKNNTFSQSLSRGKCQGSGTVQFTHLPMELNDIGVVQPYGTMVGAHVIPTSHGYISPAEFHGPRDQYAVYAIADGYIVNISHRGLAIGDNQDPNHKTDEYQMQFEHSCTFYSYYDLLTSLAPDLQQAVGKLEGFDNKSVRIPVKAGQLLGRVGGQTIDFGVWNFEKTPDYFANPKSYEEDRPYLDDMFKYFTEPLKTQLLTKAARVAEPRTGKVNYDMVGKLVGGWFKEGTGGFQGPPDVQRTAGGRYWDGHLAIAYDYIDPTSIKFSIGNWNGSATQFTVKGNAPDPATVSMESGLVKYELMGGGGYVDGDTGQPWMIDHPIAHPQFKVGSHVEGVALIQMTAPDKLKLELFPGKTTDQVTDFTAAATVYTR